MFSFIILHNSNSLAQQITTDQLHAPFSAGFVSQRIDGKYEFKSIKIGHDEIAMEFLNGKNQVTLSNKYVMCLFQS